MRWGCMLCRTAKEGKGDKQYLGVRAILYWEVRGQAMRILEEKAFRQREAFVDIKGQSVLGMFTEQWLEWRQTEWEVGGEVRGRKGAISRFSVGRLRPWYRFWLFSEWDEELLDGFNRALRLSNMSFNNHSDCCAENMCGQVVSKSGRMETS